MMRVSFPFLLGILLILLVTTSSSAFEAVPGPSLKPFVDKWYSNKAATVEKYGNISNWDVTLVTYFNNAFADRKDFNEDLSKWKTSKLTSLEGTFKNCAIFNGNVSAWEVGKVTTLKLTFYKAKAFDGDISGWNGKNVV